MRKIEFYCYTYNLNIGACLLNLYFFPQIKALKRERAETIIEKEEAVDDPLENGMRPF